MFAMSVKEVPGWSVLIVPRLIGVPVAATPGLDPHVEVSTVPGEEAAPVADAELVAVPPGVVEVLELELLHPASTPLTAMTARAAPAASERRCPYLYICSAFSWLTAMRIAPSGR